MTYTCRTTGDRTARGDWVRPMLGWIWALGTIAAAGSLAAAVHHDLDRPGQAPAILGLPDAATTTPGGWR
ncbi:hypothetical protein IPZ58_28150 [Streptomyces roseoverticillatus]|uniref:hypothetical protein n=1 Tax=Streptomyces roseoverticillatus TaxID=66429 RepID=UPI001F1C499C|nr:hypothetical protein [Streptomyces roseoverticillatus]MCF3105433.1 hypothetical protein [Streptomyces roseoverticillatus]